MQINLDKIKEWLKCFEEADEVFNVNCTVLDDSGTCYFTCVFPALEGMTIELRHNAMREVDLDKPTTVYLYAAKPTMEKTPFWAATLSCWQYSKHSWLKP